MSLGLVIPSGAKAPAGMEYIGPIRKLGEATTLQNARLLVEIVARMRNAFRHLA